MTRNSAIFRGALLAAALLALAGCGSEHVDHDLAVTVQPAPLEIAVHAEGQAKAATATRMNVPGPMYTHRQLAWVLPDGSQVKKGEVVARFSAKQSKQDLAETMVDLARNQLVHKGKEAELTATRGQLQVNLAQVASQLAIAERYANASVAAIARAKILDAVQDKEYLGIRQDVLQWRKRQSSERGQAELAVVGAKRSTLELQAQQAQSNLDALTLRAPHAGILMLKADWSGQKPQVGSQLYAGRPFATLPDLSQLEVTLQVPQIEATGIDKNLKAVIYPLGAPEQKVVSKVSWVARTASPISRQSPVKYLTVKVPIPAKAVEKYHWLPGMRFAARIILIDAKSTLSVPNLALDTRGDGVHVRVLAGGKPVERKVTLGVQGAARSQIKAGLKPGDKVLLDARTPGASS